MIEIIRKNKRDVGVRILNIKSFSIQQLDEIVRFWESTGNYEVNISY